VETITAKRLPKHCTDFDVPKSDWSFQSIVGKFDPALATEL
jgi:hypothetical protein